MSRENSKVPEYQFPTLEAAEIHSMSMEYFTYPWMELFFKEDTDKFKFTHMADNISFLPYGVAIDEFQHIVYENPELTPEERRQEWKKLEDKYLPHRDYDGIEPLESGAILAPSGPCLRCSILLYRLYTCPGFQADGIFQNDNDRQFHPLGVCSVDLLNGFFCNQIYNILMFRQGVSRSFQYYRVPGWYF